MSCLPTYLHAQAGLRACERQHLDLHPLTFADHICDICHSALSSKLRDMNQALPTFPIFTNKYIQQMTKKFLECTICKYRTLIRANSVKSRVHSSQLISQGEIKCKVNKMQTQGERNTVLERTSTLQAVQSNQTA